MGSRWGSKRGRGGREMTAEPRRSPEVHRINPPSSSHCLKITYITSLHPFTVTKQYQIQERLHVSVSFCVHELIRTRPHLCIFTRLRYFLYFRVFFFPSSFRCSTEVASAAGARWIFFFFLWKDSALPASYSSRVLLFPPLTKKQPQLRNRVYEIISGWIINVCPWQCDCLMECEPVCICVCVCLSDGGLLEGLHCMNLPLCCGTEPKASLRSKTPTGTGIGRLSKWQTRAEKAIFSLLLARTNSYWKPPTSPFYITISALLTSPPEFVLYRGQPSFLRRV